MEEFNTLYRNYIVNQNEADEPEIAQVSRQDRCRQTKAKSMQMSENSTSEFKLNKTSTHHPSKGNTQDGVGGGRIVERTEWRERNGSLQGA